MRSQQVFTRVSEIPCHCRQSQCMKLYCECFTRGELCGPMCECMSCCNKPGNADRDNAYKMVIEKSNKLSKAGSSKHQALLMRHKGCNCQKSKCLKKYCECFQQGTKCSEFCLCKDCQNKDGCGSASKQLTPEKMGHTSLNAESTQSGFNADYGQIQTQSQPLALRDAESSNSQTMKLGCLAQGKASAGQRTDFSNLSFQKAGSNAQLFQQLENCKLEIKKVVYQFEFTNNYIANCMKLQELF